MTDNFLIKESLLQKKGSISISVLDRKFKNIVPIAKLEIDHIFRDLHTIADLYKEMS